MSLTTVVADDFFKTKLAGDATLMSLAVGGAWRNQPPQGTAYPFVVWQHQAGDVLRGVGPVRIWSDLIYLVKAVGQGAALATLKSIVDRIDTLLDLARQTVASGTVVACILIGEVAYDEVVEGVLYQHLGGRYRLYCQGA